MRAAFASKLKEPLPLEFGGERHEQLTAEKIVETVGVGRAAGDQLRVEHRRILVEYVVGAGPDLHDLADVPGGLEVQVAE